MELRKAIFSFFLELLLFYSVQLDVLESDMGNKELVSASNVPMEMMVPILTGRLFHWRAPLRFRAGLGRLSLIS